MATAQTSCDCRWAIRASGEDTIPSWLYSIIPLSRRRKAQGSHRGHVLRGECWQLLSSVIITHSQTSWNKDATKDPVEMGPEMPCARPCPHERATKHHDQVSQLSHLHSPLWRDRGKKKKKNARFSQISWRQHACANDVTMMLECSYADAKVFWVVVSWLLWCYMWLLMGCLLV